MAYKIYKWQQLEGQTTGGLDTVDCGILDGRKRHREAFSRYLMWGNNVTSFFTGQYKQYSLIMQRVRVSGLSVLEIALQYDDHVAFGWKNFLTT